MMEFIPNILPHAVIVLDSNGTIVQWDPEVIYILGWERKDALGKQFTETLAPQCYREDLAALINGKVQTKKSLPDLGISITPLTVGGEYFLICNIMHPADPTAAMFKQLSVQKTQLFDFCNVVSHNLRAPLVNLSMLADFIDKNDDPAEQRLLVSKLRPVIDGLHSTFVELVESIQVKQNTGIKREEIRLKERIQPTLDCFQPEVQRLQAKILVDVDETHSVSFPAKYFSAILNNLISNALKYHSPERRPVITIRSEMVANRIILSVSDNGQGIDVAKHSHNFFKIGKVFHHHPDAKGFGLFMAKTQIEAMGGRIWVDSTVGKGTTFFVELDNPTPLI